MKNIKKLVAYVYYLRDSGFFIFIYICFEIDIGKEVPLISSDSKLNRIFFIRTKFIKVDVRLKLFEVG